MSIEVIIALTSLISAAATLLLGWWQKRIEQNKGKSDDTLSLSQAMKNMGDSWDILVDGLREENVRQKADLVSEINRIKSEYEERENKLVEDLKSMEARVQDNQKRVDAVLNNEMEKSRELEVRLSEVTIENDSLREKIALGDGEILRLQTELKETQAEVQKWQNENTLLRDRIRAIEQDVRGIKRQTGDLKPKESGDA